MVLLVDNQWLRPICVSLHFEESSGRPFVSVSSGCLSVSVSSGCFCPVRVSVDVAGHKRAQSCLSLHLAAFTGSLSGPRSLAGGHNVHFVNSTCDAWSLGARCTAPNSPLLSP